VVGLSLATIGLYASNAHLFPLPAVFLTGPALASGIAWVNSVGILGGSASPPIVGWFKKMPPAALAAGSTHSPYLALFRRHRAAICVRETPVAVGSNLLELPPTDLSLRPWVLTSKRRSSRNAAA